MNCEKVDGEVKDLLGNQGTIAKVLAETVRKEKSHLIGLEGIWGSGKSHLISLMKNELDKNKHHVFVFDAWSYQEDLQRRAFLSALTKELIAEQVLENPELPIDKEGGKFEYFEKLTDNRNWNNALDYLLANKRTSITKNKFEPHDLFFPALILFYSIPVMRFYILGDDFKFTTTQIFSAICLTMIMLGICFKDFFKEIFLNSNSKQDKEVKSEVISSLEPSVDEFRMWLKALDVSLKEEKKDLIIVFDNLDRLPQDKVRPYWSLIHTFFAENGDCGESSNGSEHFEKNKKFQFESINVIVPFDRSNLKDIFIETSSFNRKSKIERNSTEEKEEKQDISIDEFINKIFSITFRVPVPIVTSWREFYRKKFSEKLEKTFSLSVNEAKEKSLLIFDFLIGDVTPRRIIDFIKELDLLITIYKETEGLKNNEEISLEAVEAMSIFILRKRKILKGDPTSNLLGIKELVSDALLSRISIDENKVAQYLSALTFNVKFEEAANVLLKRKIEKAFQKGDNSSGITEISKRGLENDTDSLFFDVLEDTFNDYVSEFGTSNFYTVAGGLEAIDKEYCSKYQSRVQKMVATIIGKIEESNFPSEDLALEGEDKFLLLNSSDDYREKYLRKYISHIQKRIHFRNSKNSALDCVNVIKQVNKFLTENHFEFDLAEYIVGKSVDVDSLASAAQFLEFLDEVEFDFNKYKLTIKDEKETLYPFILEMLENIRENANVKFEALKYLSSIEHSWIIDLANDLKNMFDITHKYKSFSDNNHQLHDICKNNFSLCHKLIKAFKAINRDEEGEIEHFLGIQINDTDLTQFMANWSKSDSFTEDDYELLTHAAIALMKNNTSVIIPSEIKKVINPSEAFEDGLIKELAERLPAYMNYSKLLGLTLSSEHEITKELAKYTTLNEETYQLRLNIVQALTNIEKYAEVLDIKILDLLGKFNGWITSAEEKINSEDVLNIIRNIDQISAIIETKDEIELSKFLLGQITENLSNKDKEFYKESFFDEVDTLELSFIKVLIDKDLFSDPNLGKLKITLEDSLKEVLRKVARGEQVNSDKDVYFKALMKFFNINENHSLSETFVAELVEGSNDLPSFYWNEYYNSLKLGLKKIETINYYRVLNHILNPLISSDISIIEKIIDDFEFWEEYLITSEDASNEHQEAVNNFKDRFKLKIPELIRIYKEADKLDVFNKICENLNIDLDTNPEDEEESDEPNMNS